ncbi:hypothetical protein CHS0354_032789 [Potamilus streckersoni]|uniref:J domain-containing protein n=1 Tax=Potamilus streckersoni TaxID=2493646 RepID=A0AAE0S976_9BIVA|nr:hypothetical protein CHS0354_032789 [Potamilus streckersoni]
MCYNKTFPFLAMLSCHPFRSKLNIKQCSNLSKVLSSNRCNKCVKAPRSVYNPTALNYSSRVFHVRSVTYSVRKNPFSYITSLIESERGTDRHGKHFSSTGLPVILPGSSLGCVGIPLLMTCFLYQGKKLTHVQFRKYSMTRGKASHYDVLGLPTHSTQAQIKNAFFKLSKLYHPDVNDSKEAVSKFHDILEAYEVLRNVRKRRMYDEGIQNPDDPRYEHTDSRDYTNGFRSSEKFGRQRYQAPPTGRSNIYNFDEFYKQHYGESLRRDRVNKARMEQRNKENDTSDKSAGNTINGLVFVTIFMATIALVLGLGDK